MVLLEDASSRFRSSHSLAEIPFLGGHAFGRFYFFRGDPPSPFVRNLNGEVIAKDYRMLRSHSGDHIRSVVPGFTLSGYLLVATGGDARSVSTVVASTLCISGGC